MAQEENINLPGNILQQFLRDKSSWKSQLL
jgi:hypothetical protein